MNKLARVMQYFSCLFRQDDWSKPSKGRTAALRREIDLDLDLEIGYASF